MERKMKLPQHLQMDTVSPATRLLEKRRLMYEVEDAFNNQKKEFERREEQFKLRENELRKKDLEIQESLIRFSKYLQDNEAKKQRANKRAVEEQQAILQKEQEITLKEKELRDVKEESERFERKVNEMKKYEKFLERVRDKFQDDFQDLTDILNRHNTLDQANKNLREKQQNTEAELEELRNLVDDYEKKKNNEIISLNNDIALLQKRLEEKEEQKNELQKTVEVTNKTAIDQTSELGQILMAINNIYKTCGKRKNLKHKIENEVEYPQHFENFQVKGKLALQQLIKIGAFLEDFKVIIEQCKQKPQEKKGAGFTESTRP